MYIQAIKDAEADERIADQLAALQLTLSQLAEQEAAVDGGTSTEADATGGTKNHRPDSSDKVSHFYLVSMQPCLCPCKGVSACMRLVVPEVGIDGMHCCWICLRESSADG